MPIIISILVLFTAMNTQVLFDYNTAPDRSRWRIVNDNVMGGRSNGSLSFKADGTAVFEGRISLENNGGFASLRFYPGSVDLEDYENIVLSVNGHGKRFQFRVKADREDDHSYISYVTTADGWQEVELSLQEFYPSFRGRKLDRPNFPGRKLEEIGFLFGNNKEEDFRLEVRRIILK